MTNTKKYLLAALAGTALTLGSAAPALADHGPHHGHGGHGSYGRDHDDRDHGGRGYGDHDRDHGGRDYGDRDHGGRDRYDDHRGDSRGTECSNHSAAYAEGVVANSPGVLSGNLVQVVVDAPINVCGNSVGVG